MPSAFDSEFAAAALPEMFAVFGRAATYLQADGASSSACTATLQLSDAQTETQNNETRDVRRAVVQVRDAEATPEVGGTFNFPVDSLGGAAAAWIVINAPVLRAGCWSCDCESVTTRAVNRRRVR